MKQSLELELGIFILGLIPYSNLHAIFDELKDISGQNSKEKSFWSMSLDCAHKILDSLEW